MDVGVRPRKRLKIVEPAVVSLVVWVCTNGLFLPPVCSKGWREAAAGTASHLISQLDQAIESYATDYGAYPPGGGSGSRELVEYLSRKGPRKHKYFEFQQDLLNGGSVLNPVWSDGDRPANIIHYRCPGVFRPGRFDLWAADSSGDPMGINNW